MIPAHEIEDALKVSIRLPLNAEIRNSTYMELLTNTAPWIQNDVDGLRIPAVVAGEFARLILINSKFEISGSPRADYISTVFARFRKNLKHHLRLACAFGGILFRPYVCGNQLSIDVTTADRFFPISYDDDLTFTDSVIYDCTKSGDMYFHKLERQQYDRQRNTCTITNHFFKSKSCDALGDPCTAEESGIWAGLSPEVIIRGASSPLFAYFRIPSLRTESEESLRSPLGTSVFSECIELFRSADLHWARIDWEYEGSELAVDVSSDMLKPVRGVLTLPKRIERLFRGHNIDPVDSGSAMTTFSPSIRDSSLFNGLDNIFRRIEFNSFLAYGTLSNPQNVDKTAEEVRASKNRSYSAVCDMQEALEDALRDLLDIMDTFCTLYGLAPSGEYEAVFEWGDGVLEDTDKEFQRRLQLCTAGKLKVEKLISWYFGCSEEEAADYLPDSSQMKLFGQGM